MSEIPGSARVVVKARAGRRCERCGVPAHQGHWHHRRTRAVDDQHTHCPCNGVWLCTTCHQWVHAHPHKAKKGGWIVTRYAYEPETFPVMSYLGERMHLCDGDVIYYDTEQP